VVLLPSPKSQIPRVAAPGCGRSSPCSSSTSSPPASTSPPPPSSPTRRSPASRSSLPLRGPVAWPWQLGRARESCGCSWWWWEAIAPCSSLRFATFRTKSTGATTVLLDSISFEYAQKSSSSTSTSFTNSLPHYPIENPTPPCRASPPRFCSRTAAWGAWGLLPSPRPSGSRRGAGTARGS